MNVSRVNYCTVDSGATEDEKNCTVLGKTAPLTFIFLLPLWRYENRAIYSGPTRGLHGCFIILAFNGYSQLHFA